MNLEKRDAHDSGIALDEYFCSVQDRMSESGSDSLSSGSYQSEASSESLVSTPSSSALSSPRLSSSDSLCLDTTFVEKTFSLSDRRRRTSAYAASVVRREAEALLALARRLDEKDEIEDSPAQQSAATDFDAAVQILEAMPLHGKLLISGIGKSALLGRKAVATFCSLGIPATFLCPVAALHGDLGVISPMKEDVLLAISYSGRTQEMLSLLNIVKDRCSSLIALTGNGQSPLARMSDVWLDGSISGDGLEADPSLPAPTSSVAVALGLLHALGLSVMREKTGWEAHESVRQEVFLRCHPGGTIGQTLIPTL